VRKKVMAIVFAVLAFSLIAASAATLGGITTDPGVGAESTTVNASCDSTGVHASFGTTWDSAQARFEVSSVTVSEISDACVGQQITVVLTQAGVEVTRGPAAVNENGVGLDDNSRSWNLGDSDIQAQPDFDIHISISG
jgi:hypothetical protein